MASNASLPARGLPAKPPDKGSFPLDHFRECSEAKTEYMNCLKAHAMKADAVECRELSAAYLQCRMDRKLMAVEAMPKLGFHSKTGAPEQAQSTETPHQEDKRRGYIAGLPAK